MRTSLKPQQNAFAYEKLRRELEELLRLEENGYIKVYFGDESGFCLNPTIPYGWQDKNKHRLIVPKKSKRRNVFGILSRRNEYHGFSTVGSMNAEVLISFLDEFVQLIKEKTVIVLDNAPFHHANVFKNKIKEWQEQDLYIWFLPPYSPHLNLIETLWRKIKYEWLKPADYANWNALNKALDNIFKNIGQELKINFKNKLSII